ncbi:MAG: serine hydrolase domain-containing protein [Candidatus Baltobacteraceae bacterium]
MHNSRFSSISVYAVLAALLFIEVPAAAASPPTMDDALNAIAAYAPQALAEQDAPGVSIAITDKTHTLRVIALGFANLDAKTPVTAQTRFPVGSITKGMTATALMELRDAGTFDPAKPVRSYLPWWSIRSGGATIYAHQLLSHTAGIPDDYTFAPGYLFSVAALRQAQTIFTPGTRWSYSNDGLSSAGAILAALDGRPWEQSVQARVFDRLGMTHTSAAFTPQTLSDAANGYVFSEMNAIVPDHPHLVSSLPGDFVDPAGTVISTPGDMARYMRFLLNGGAAADGAPVVSAQSYAMMTTPDDMHGKPAGQATPELSEAPLLYQHYGFGLGLHEENGEKHVSHTGGIAGYSACMDTNVTRGFGVIAMSNLVEAPLHPCAIVLYAMQVLRAQSAGEALPPAPAAQGMYLQRSAVANAAKLAGTYTAPDGSQLTFVPQGAGVALQNGSTPETLYARGGNTFYVNDRRFAVYGLTFVPDKSGAIAQLYSGDQWYYGAAYRGLKTFSAPAHLAQLAGRYEGDQLWGQSIATRVFAVKGRLTADGSPLLLQKDRSYRLGTSAVRFDTLAAGQMQRMWIDGIPFYRIDLP